VIDSSMRPLLNRLVLSVKRDCKIGEENRFSINQIETVNPNVCI
jgi:hypothetical protein